jgi:hypothetical protein
MYSSLGDWVEAVQRTPEYKACSGPWARAVHGMHCSANRGLVRYNRDPVHTLDTSNCGYQLSPHEKMWLAMDSGGEGQGDDAARGTLGGMTPAEARDWSRLYAGPSASLDRSADRPARRRRRRGARRKARTTRYGRTSATPSLALVRAKRVFSRHFSA